MIILTRVSVAVKQRIFFFIFEFVKRRISLKGVFSANIRSNIKTSQWTARTKLKITLLRALPTSEIKQDFVHLRDFKVISLKATVLLAFSRFFV